MKKIFLSIALLSGMLLTSCKEQEIPVFGESHILYFEKFWKDANFPGNEKADSTETSFYFINDDVNVMSVDLVMVISSRMLEKNMPFKLQVVPEMTTALADEYTLENQYEFRAMPIPEGAKQIEDTIHIKLNRSKRIEQLKDGYRLVLEVVPTTIDGIKVIPGQFERSKAVIHVSKEPVKPEWWDMEVSSTLLGDYSPLKYKLFLQNIPNAEKVNKRLIKQHPDEVRKIVLLFKKWLIDHPQQENGEIMDVPV